MLRIAIASSGLGHVARGIESWAMDTAAALAERGVDVTLFAGGEVECSGFSVQCSGGNEPEHRTSNNRPQTTDNGQRTTDNGQRTTDNGQRTTDNGQRTTDNGQRTTLPRIIVLHCLRRFEHRTGRLVRLTPRWGWRWGLKSGYGWEQFSFWWRLWPRLRKKHYDILHVQDPMLAYWCRKCRKLGLVKTREILAHGTEEPAEWLRQFEYVQHLAPWHLEQVSGVRCQSSVVRGQAPPPNRPSSICHHWVAIPNFVDTDVFRPARDPGEKLACREKLGIPPYAFVVGTAATVKKPHKRIDYLIREFAAYIAASTSNTEHRTPTLFIAGARTPQSDELVALAEQLAPGRVRFCFDLPRAKMPDFYRSLDVFALASVFEMMPIAVLEALAGGLPVVCNDTPVLRWMVGEGESGGACIDMARDGALAEFLEAVDAGWISERGRASRERALAVFSTEAVIGQYVDYYRRILGGKRL